MSDATHHATAPEDRIPFLLKVVYGFGAFVNNTLAAAIGGMMIVLNLGLGMSPALVGLLGALPRLTDAITDPLMGYISDNTRSRWGRRRPYMLVGPGRWGTSDHWLGIPVKWDQISAARVIVEANYGDFVVEPSFGTHFFQDLVEADIRYLPLYPDEPDSTLDQTFLRRAKNLLPEMLPEFSHIADVLRVVDVDHEREGRVLRVLMNADLDEAVAHLAEPGPGRRAPEGGAPMVRHEPVQFWRWRFRMAERMVRAMDPAEYGVKAVYLIGSVKNGTAGPGSDIDLLVHVRADDAQRRQLEAWLDGWSRALAEVNYLRTGYRSEGLLDVHLVTDEDIAKQTSYAAKIGAVTDAARELVLGESAAG